MKEKGLVDLDRPRIGNDLYRHPLIPQTAIGTDPQDGLPRMTTHLALTDSLAPSLDPATFVCMGDESVFVMRDLWGEVKVEFEPHEVRRSDEEYFVERAKLDPEVLLEVEQLERELQEVGALSRAKHPWVKVEPLRPQCRYYKRIMTDFEGESGKSLVRAVERVCSAQKTEGGEYMALRDTRVYACEHRMPRDFVSEERLREFDQRAIDQAKQASEERDIEAELAQRGAPEGET